MWSGPWSSIPTIETSLVRFEFPDVTVWATPGGGVEPEEDEETALRRALAEETGLIEFELGTLVWTREHRLTIDSTRSWRRERVFWCGRGLRASAPVVLGALTGEGMTALRWWPPHELALTDVRLAPRRMPELIAGIITEGPPQSPIEAGI